MKKVFLTSMLTVIAILFSAASYADKVTVNGTTYECSNSCSINSGPPMTIEDCCGGTVARLRREAIVID